MRRWKKSSGLTWKQIAGLVGISGNHARKMGCGAVERTSPQLAERFEKESRGLIKAEELVFPERHGKKKRGAA